MHPAIIEVIMDLENIETLKIEKYNENSIIIFKADTGNMPLHIATEYLQNIQNMLTPVLSPAKVLVMPNTIGVIVLEKEETNRKVFHIDTDVPAEKVQEIVDRVSKELGI